MSNTESRIVRMQFDNTQFKKAAGETQKQLTDIDKAVSQAGNGKGLLSMAGHMETVRVKASAMQVAAVTAIANIANRAVDAGIKIAKSLTLDPIKAGFDEYELKMKSIQTILSNTKGETLKTVTVRLNELNEYSDKTIYNFGNMTEAIGKMTTAGIGLDDATQVVKGFHNMVALAGGDATQAAGAMEQFVYGLQAGKITALDWQSIATRGLGSQSLQKAFFETAKAAGTLEGVPVGTTFEEWSKAAGGFKGSLESGWLTSDVATKALSAMTGDIKTVQEMMALGFDEKTAKDMLDIANNAVESATKVRTLTAFMGTLKEQLGSGWSQIMEVIFGDFNEATKMFTKFSNITGQILTKFFGYLEGLIKRWDEFGGRLALMHTFRNLLAPIVAIFKVLSGLWAKAFPSEEAGSGLASFTILLQRLTRPLNILAKVITGQITPMQGFFRILGVGRRILRSVSGAFESFVTRIAEMLHIPLPDPNSGFLGFLKEVWNEIERVIKQVQRLIDKGDSIKEALGKVKFDIPDLPDVGGSLPSLPGGLGGKLSGISGIFGGGASMPTGKVSTMADNVSKLTESVGLFNEEDKKLTSGFMFNPDAKLDTSRITDVGSEAVDSLRDNQQEAETIGDKMGGTFATIKEKLGSFITNFNWDDLLASINLAVLSVFIIRLSQMMDTFSKSAETFMGLGASYNQLITDMGGALKSFQTAARAKLIIAIAIAIGILALSLWLLSRIPADKLFYAMTALGGIAFITKRVMESLTETIEKMDKKGTGMKMLALGATMVLFGLAILLLATAMRKLNGVDWDAAVMAGAAMWGLMKVMERLSELDSEGIVRSAFAMILVSGALWLFAVAIKKFAGLDLATFGEGIIYAALALATLTTLMKGFESSLGGAAALVVVTVALWLLVDVIEKFAALKWQTFVEGMGYIAGALLVLVVALYGFQSSLAGAAALIVAVGALYILVGVIEAFAKLDWETFAKGMGMIAISFLVLGGLMALLGVFSPLILLGAAAILIFGAAIFLLGAGLLFLAKGMGALILISGGVVAAITAFAVGAAIGIGVFLQTLALQAPIMKDSFLKILQTLIDTLVAAVPMVIDGIKRLWAAIMKELGGGDKKGGAKGVMMEETGQSWISKLAEGVKKKIPEIVDKAIDLFKRFMGGLIDRAAELGGVGARFVAKLISGIAENIGGIVESAVDLVVNFAEALGNNLDRIVTAGINLIADFLHDLADAIRHGSAAIGSGLADVVDAMWDVGVDMVQGLIDGLGSMLDNGLSAIGSLASSMIDKAKDMFKIFSPSKVFRDIGAFLVDGLTKGIQDNAASAITAVASMVSGQIAIASEYVSKFIQKLDQQAIAAYAKAAGLQKAAKLAADEAEEATRKAEKTKKNKKDDKRAREMTKDAKRLQKKADRAERQAEKADDKVAAARAKRERAEEFQDSTLIEKAQMRSEDAQNQLDAAKQAELNAASKRAEAQALRQAAKGAGKKDAEKMRAQADKLEAQAEKEAERSNDLLKKARQSAIDALEYQKQAGAEAAASFREQYDAQARADEEEEKFNKMTDAEKAATRRQQAAALQAKADADLLRAQQLAFTDLEAANELAQQAMDQADLSRQYLVEAADLEEQVKQAAMAGTGTSEVDTGGTVVNLDPTQAAAIAFGDYAALYDMGTAAAAAGRTVQFNQYNTSPEALNPTEVYRLTNNQLNSAAGRLTPAA